MKCDHFGKCEVASHTEYEGLYKVELCDVISFKEIGGILIMEEITGKLIKTLVSKKDKEGKVKIFTNWSYETVVNGKVITVYLEGIKFFDTTNVKDANEKERLEFINSRNYSTALLVAEERKQDK